MFKKRITVVLFVLITFLIAIGIAACTGSPETDNIEQSNPSTTIEQPPVPSTPVQEEPVIKEPAQDEPVNGPQIPSGAIDWSEAGRHIGENATIYGEVKSVNYATGSRGKPTFINIGVNYPDTKRVTALIWEDYRGNFSPSPESQYSGKIICVTGYIDTYNGVAQIEVRSPSQIEIIE